MGILGGDVPEEIGVDPVFQRPLAEVRTRMDTGDAHLPHGGLDTLPAHDESLLGKNGRNAATAEERPAGVDLVDPVAEKDLLGRRRDRLVVEAGAGDPQQRGLGGKGK